MQTDLIADSEYDDFGINGWMGEDELVWLYEKAKEMSSIVEIGSWFGRSTHALLSGCKGTVYAIDTFLGSPSEIDGAHAFAKTGDVLVEFLKNVGHFKNLDAIQEDSCIASKMFADNSIDMVFVDGDHAYEAVKKDLECWYPKCRKLFCGHDKDQDGVPKALEELGKPYFHAAGTLWFIPIQLI
jgi:hypothetical protein